MYTRCEKEGKIVGAHLFICKLLLICEFHFLYLLLPSQQGLYSKKRCKYDIVLSFDKRCLDLFFLLEREEIILAKVI